MSQANPVMCLLLTAALGVAAFRTGGRQPLETTVPVLGLADSATPIALALKSGNFGTRDFFAKAPKLNPSRSLITGVICGYRVEEITNCGSTTIEGRQLTIVLFTKCKQCIFEIIH